jgi:hypothetical protein
MRADAAVADRRQAVRRAARAWKRGGAIDAATLAAIETAYPDDRRRLGPVFRVVVFGFSFVALNAFLLLIATCTGGAGAREIGFAVVCLMAAVGLAAVTEVLVGPLRRADSGLETATALLAILYAIVGIGILAAKPLGSDRALFPFLFVLTTALAALGSRRWGSPTLACVATIAALFFLARLPGGRVVWMVTTLALLPLLLRGSESPALPPVHRRSLLFVLLIALGALYVSLHIGSWDYGWIEWIADFRDEPAAPGSALRLLYILATALIPIAVIAFGVATRRAALLNMGLLLGVASLVTLRFYVHVAPAWVVLIGSGSAALLTTLLLRRWLVSGPQQERFGFTADPLFQDTARRHLVEVAAVMVQVGPDARTIPAEPDKFQAGGGGYGGGGASGDF